MNTVLSPAPDAAPARRRGGNPWVWLAPATMAGAGALHLLAAVDHARHDAGTLVAGFFLTTGLAQLGAAGWLAKARLLGARPRPLAVLALVAGTVGLIGLYLVVHTTDWLAGVVGEHAAGAGRHGHPAADGHGFVLDGPVALGGEVGSGPAPAETLGTVTVAVEVLGTMALCALLPGAWRARTVNALMGVGCLTWVLWLTGMLE